MGDEKYRLEIVLRFKNALSISDSFEISQFHSHWWKVQSNACVISILFEQFGGEYGIQIQERAPP